MIFLYNNYAISGGAQYHFFAINKGNIVNVNSITATISGTPAFSQAFAASLQQSELGISLITWSGSATGVRYKVTNGSIIITATGSVAELPGDASGSGTNFSASPWGLYT